MIEISAYIADTSDTVTSYVKSSTIVGIFEDQSDAFERGVEQSTKLFFSCLTSDIELSVSESPAEINKRMELAKTPAAGDEAIKNLGGGLYRSLVAHSKTKLKNSDGLLPCPFCGSKSHRSYEDGMVMCSACKSSIDICEDAGCKIDGVDTDQSEEQVRACAEIRWNRRA